MKQTDKPDALLLVSSRCPFCHTLETLLGERMGRLGTLDIINIEQHPEVAQQHGVRSVPWLQLGAFVFDEAMTPAELDAWIAAAGEGRGQARYLGHLLEKGRLAKAIEWIEQGHATLKEVMPLLADADTRINVRVGVGAILEHFEDTDAIRAVVPELLGLLEDDNPATRIDACHYLALAHDRAALAPLEKMLDDADPGVREVAGESIEALGQ
jgi:thioredoxin-like negative regulator of GroEL